MAVSVSLKVSNKQSQPVTGVTFYSIVNGGETIIPADYNDNNTYLLKEIPGATQCIKVTHQSYEEVSYDYNKLMKINTQQIFMGDKGDRYYSNHNLLIPYNLVNDRIGIVPVKDQRDAFDKLIHILNDDGWTHENTAKYNEAKKESLIVGAKKDDGIEACALLQHIRTQQSESIAGPLIKSIWGYSVLTNIITVTFKFGTGTSTIDDMVHKHHLKVIKSNSNENSYTVNSGDNIGEEVVSIADQLLKTDAVEFADVSVLIFFGQR